MRKRSWAIRFLRFVLIVTLLSAAAGQTALAQLGTATISGIVTDSNGAVVLGANVTAISTNTGFGARPCPTNWVNTTCQASDPAPTI
jgi:hypothetical protein